MGRPTILTPEIQAKVVEALKIGSPRRAAADFAGISEASFMTWMRKGAPDAEDSPSAEEYAQFAKAVIEAEADAEQLAIRTINDVMKTGDPSSRLKASHLWLSRRRGADWVDKATVKIETDITEPDFRRALDAATPDELAQIRGPLRGDAPAQDAIVRAILQRLRVG